MESLVKDGELEKTQLDKSIKKIGQEVQDEAYKQLTTTKTKHVNAKNKGRYSVMVLDKDRNLVERNISNRNSRKIFKAEKYLGRPLRWDDGFEDNGSDINQKSLRYLKTYDKNKSYYKSVKRKGDPDYDWLTGYDPEKHISLGDRDIRRIMKKIGNKPYLDIKKEVDNAKNKKIIEKRITQYLKDIGPYVVPVIATATATYVNKHKK